MALSVSSSQQAVDELFDGKRSGREARLDFLLAEELAVDPEFARWFIAEAQLHRVIPDLPVGPPSGARVRINFFEDAPPIPADASGETDVDAVLNWDDGCVLPILIEDKLWSPFQPRQPQRYADRACLREGAAVLVAPAAYVSSHATTAAPFHGHVAIESIIEYLRAQASHSNSETSARRNWRADRLSELIRGPDTPPDHDPTVEFTQFCVDWLTRNAPAVVPYTRSLHTEQQDGSISSCRRASCTRLQAGPTNAMRPWTCTLPDRDSPVRLKLSTPWSTRSAFRTGSASPRIDRGAGTSSSATDAQRSSRHKGLRPAPKPVRSSMPSMPADESRTGSRCTNTASGRDTTDEPGWR